MTNDKNKEGETIEGLDEAIAVFEKGAPDLADYETVGVYFADCERYADRCLMVLRAARAYSRMQKREERGAENGGDDE